LHESLEGVQVKEAKITKTSPEGNESSGWIMQISSLS
jgi:hypothetical protein